MKKVHYKYDSETLSYTAVTHGFKYYASRLLFHLSFGVVASVILFFAYVYLFDSPEEKKLKRENRELLSQYEYMSRKLDQVEEVLADVCSRDENIYRTVYGADSIPRSVRKSGFGGVNRYEDLENITNSEIVLSTRRRLDELSKQLYIQSVSFDEIIELAKRNDELIACMPAIMPLNNKDLTRTASGWGWRIHPIYKIKKFHQGMDFSAPAGTEIYATGNGTVKEVKTSYSGYGKHVIIDHGFGYQTLYGHMSKFNVKAGQKVKRGDIIGYVGSTGTSTAPHLHYEVLEKGNRVNPQFYYFQEDLTPDEYARMIDIATNTNQTFD